MLALGVLFAAPQIVTSLPHRDNYLPRDSQLAMNMSHPFGEFDLSFIKRQVAKIPLRILPLGASIMHGYGSSLPDGSLGNGFVTRPVTHL